MKKSTTQRMVLTGFFMALGLVLPVITGRMTQIGNMLLPMHIPVLLCGFICGWQYGLIAGIVTPIFRSFIFGMPPLFPVAAAMAFELASYGTITGAMNRLLPKKNWSIYVTLLTAMLGGRVVWGIVKLIFAGVTNTKFTYAMFVAGAVTEAIPGIVVQIVLIPILVIVCRKALKYDQ